MNDREIFLEFDDLLSYEHMIERREVDKNIVNTCYEMWKESGFSYEETIGILQKLGMIY